LGGPSSERWLLKPRFIVPFTTEAVGVVGFKNQQRICNGAAFPAAVPACEPSQWQRADNEEAKL